MCQNELALRNTSLTDETLHIVVRGDLAAVDAVSEAAIGVAIEAPSDALGLVPFVGYAERIQEVVLFPQPAIDTGFDLAGVHHGHLVAFFGFDRQTQLTGSRNMLLVRVVIRPRQVLHVHLVVAAPAQSVRRL